MDLGPVLEASRITQEAANLEMLVANLRCIARGLAHDLRGPIGSIVELAAMVSTSVERGRSADAVRLTSLIDQEARRALQTMAGILALEHATDCSLRSSTVDARAVVGAQVAQLQRRGVLADAHVAVRALPLLRSDEVLLGQVVVNLIENSVKFARLTGRQPQVIVYASEDRGCLWLVVRDNGPGMPVDGLDRLFTPFSRLHGGKVAGSGLGLAVVKQIADRLGAEPFARNATPHGAEFGLKFPMSLVVTQPLGTDRREAVSEG